LAMGSVVVVALIGLVLSLPLRRSGASDTGRHSPVGGTRVSPLALFLAGYAVLMGFGVSAVNAFLPLFGYEVLSIPASRVGLLISIVGFVGAASRVLMGLVGNRVDRFEGWLAALAAAAALST